MANPKKKNTISNGRKGNQIVGAKIPGTNKRMIRAYRSEDPKLIVKPKKKIDPEDVANLSDEAANLKYPPPKKNEKFVEIWTKFIESVSTRENFNIGHLHNLEILCDLYVEYEDLHKFIRVNGRSYQVYGRQGKLWKFFPEVSHMKSVQMQIKTYTNMLGLNLKKEHGGKSGGEEENWE